MIATKYTKSLGSCTLSNKLANLVDTIIDSWPVLTSQMRLEIVIYEQTEYLPSQE